ncbi:MAG: hypothetical protein R3C42_05915 [Parvularculaceae bacterium]
MSEAGWSLQKAIYSTLIADATLKTLIGDPPRVYDLAPDRAAFPMSYSATRERNSGVDGLVEHDMRIIAHSRVMKDGAKSRIS